MSAAAGAQSMAESMRSSWHSYIFVSTTTPSESLVELAREASQAGAQLVLRGFAGGKADLQQQQAFVGSINAQCCRGRAVAWVVDPRLFDRYHVTVVPTFVVAWGDAARAQDFSAVSGDMALGNALKFMVAESHIAAVRERAASVYAAAFGGQP